MRTLCSISVSLGLLLVLPNAGFAQNQGRGEEPSEAPVDATEVVEEAVPGIPTGADETFPGGDSEVPTEAAPGGPPAEGPEEVREIPPAVEQGPLEEKTPLLESWSFWVAVSAVVLGIIAAVVVDLTTDDPRPSLPDEPEPRGAPMGLEIRFDR